MPPAKPTILAIDDNPANLKLLQSMLGDEYRLLGATGRDKAFEIIRVTLPDLVLLDIVMPGVDGYQVCAELKANPATKEIPVIFVTVLNTELDEAAGFAAGAVDYITIPLRPAIVKARIRSHLALSAANAELTRANVELRTALAELKRLQGLLRICAWCKNICDDKGRWVELEQFITERSTVSFTHGLCPECLKKNFPEAVDHPGT